MSFAAGLLAVQHELKKSEVRHVECVSCVKDRAECVLMFFTSDRRVHEGLRENQ